MKKLLSFSLALMLLLGILAVPALAETKTCGVLSYLNIEEEDDIRFSTVRRPFLSVLFLQGVLAGDSDVIYEEETRHIADAISGAELQILEDENHGSYIVHSEKIAKLIIDYCRTSR